MSTTHVFNGHTITHTFPGQWEVEIDGVVHLFPSLKTAKAWISEVEDQK